jgi:hypothetical protein
MKLSRESFAKENHPGTTYAKPSLSRVMTSRWAEAATRPLKYRDVFQQRNDAEDNDDDPRDLLGAAVERQQIDQIEDQNNDQKRDECADNHRKPPENG